MDLNLIDINQDISSDVVSYTTTLQCLEELKGVPGGNFVREEAKSGPKM